MRLFRRIPPMPTVPTLALVLAPVAAIFIGCASGPSPETPTATLFRDVAVLSMREGGAGPVPGRSVLIRGGRIAAIAGVGEIAPPPGARVVEGEGRVLMPGLADLHVHLERLPDPRLLDLFLAHGVTTVRNMDGRPFVLDWRRRVETGDLAGPRIVTAGPILEGAEPFWDDTRVVPGPEEARRAVAEQAEAGYDFVKVYHTLDPATYRAVLEAARQHGLPVAGHAPNGVPLAEILAGGQVTIEHLDGYLDAVESEDSPHRNGWTWHKLYFGVPIDPEALRTAARETAEAGAWNVPTLTVKAKIDRPEVVAGWLDDPRLRYLPDELVDAWRPENFPQLAHLDDADLEALRLGSENRRRTVAALAGAGAGVLAGTDTPNPFVIPGASLHEELERLVAAGLTPREALAAATSRVGAFLGGSTPGRGTVTAGAPADLVLVAGDPTEDIAHAGRIAGVMVAGRWLPRAELDARLEALAGD